MSKVAGCRKVTVWIREEDYQTLTTKYPQWGSLTAVIRRLVHTHCSRLRAVESFDKGPQE